MPGISLRDVRLQICGVAVGDGKGRVAYWMGTMSHIFEEWTHDENQNMGGRCMTWPNRIRAETLPCL